MSTLQPSSSSESVHLEDSSSSAISVPGSPIPPVETSLTVETQTYVATGPSLLTGFKPPGGQKRTLAMSELEREDKINLALKRIEQGTSYRKAAKEIGISFGTIYGRFRGRKSRVKAQEARMKLTFLEEAIIEKMLLTSVYLGKPYTQPYFVQAANLFLQAQGDSNPEKVTRQWYRHFRRRHPSMDTREFSILHNPLPARNLAEIAASWLKKVTDICQLKSITNSNIYCMDEFGYVSGPAFSSDSDSLHPQSKIGHQNREFNTFKSLAATTKRALTSDEHVIIPPPPQNTFTFIETVSVGNNILPPYVVYPKSSDFDPKSLSDVSSVASDPFAYNSFKFRTSETGWLNSALILDWLVNHFDRLTKAQANGGYRLLLLDTHAIHFSMEFLNYGVENKIIFLFMPPSEYISTPFSDPKLSPLKSDIYKTPHESDTISSVPFRPTLANFVSAINAARRQAFTPETIASLWKTSQLEIFGSDNKNTLRAKDDLNQSGNDIDNICSSPSDKRRLYATYLPIKDLDVDLSVEVGIPIGEFEKVTSPSVLFSPSMTNGSSLKPISLASPTNNHYHSHNNNHSHNHGTNSLPGLSTSAAIHSYHGSFFSRHDSAGAEISSTRGTLDSVFNPKSSTSLKYVKDSDTSESKFESKQSDHNNNRHKHYSSTQSFVSFGPTADKLIPTMHLPPLQHQHTDKVLSIFSKTVSESPSQNKSIFAVEHAEHFAAENHTFIQTQIQYQKNLEQMISNIQETLNTLAQDLRFEEKIVTPESEHFNHTSSYNNSNNNNPDHNNKGNHNALIVKLRHDFATLQDEAYTNKYILKKAFIENERVEQLFKNVAKKTSSLSSDLVFTSRDKCSSTHPNSNAETEISNPLHSHDFETITGGERGLLLKFAQYNPKRRHTNGSLTIASDFAHDFPPFGKTESISTSSVRSCGAESLPPWAGRQINVMNLDIMNNKPLNALPPVTPPSLSGNTHYDTKHHTHQRQRDPWNRKHQQPSNSHHTSPSLGDSFSLNNSSNNSNRNSTSPNFAYRTPATPGLQQYSKPDQSSNHLFPQYDFPPLTELMKPSSGFQHSFPYTSHDSEKHSANTKLPSYPLSSISSIPQTSDTARTGGVTVGGAGDAARGSTTSCAVVTVDRDHEMALKVSNQ